VLILDRLLVGGVRFVLDKIAAAVDAELWSEDAVREELLAAQMRLELGEISDDEFAALETALARRLREIREHQRGGPAPPLCEMKVVGADAEVVAQEVRRAAPQPQVAPAPVVRLLAGVLDLLPALAAFKVFKESAPWVPPASLALWLGLGISFLHASPGQWLMRLRVRTDADGDVAPMRAAVRAFLQWGWAAALGLAYSLITGSHGALVYVPLGIGGAVWAVVALLGTLPAVLRKPTLVDQLTRTRVLVDVR